MLEIILSSIFVFAVILFFYFRYLFKTRFIPFRIKQAKSLFEKDKYKALELLTSILTADRGNLEANWLMAGYYRGTGQLVLAQMYLNEILNYDSFSSVITEQSVREELADLLFKMGEFGKAMFQYQVLQRLKWISPGALKQAVRMNIISYHYPQARRLLDSAIRGNPNDGELYLLGGLIEFGNNNFSLAEDAFKIAFMKGFKSPELYLHQGKTFFINKKFEEALQCFQNLSDEELGSPELESLLGQCFFHLKDYKAAIETLQKTLPDVKEGKNRQYLDATYILGCAFESSGNLKRAMEIWEKITEEYPYYSNAAQKIFFYTTIAVKDNIRNFILSPFEIFLQKTIELLPKIGFQMKEKIYEDEKSLEFLCTDIKDLNPFHNYFIDIRRYTSVVTAASLSERLMEMGRYRAKFLVVIAPYFEEEALNMARKNLVTTWDFSVYVRNQVI